MTTYDSAYLLAQFNRLAGRPATDAISDTTKYEWLTEAQNQVVGDILARAPYSFYGAPIQMTTTDGGYTFTFGLDANGYPLFPMGKASIYPSLGAVPDYPLSEGRDYLSEGARIRIPNNLSYAGPLYWRGVSPPADISASSEPTLLPEMARELIVIQAVRNFAEAGGFNPDLASFMAAQWVRAFPRWMLVYRTQFRSGGGLAPLTGVVSPLGVDSYSPGI